MMLFCRAYSVKQQLFIYIHLIFSIKVLLFSNIYISLQMKLKPLYECFSVGGFSLEHCILCVVFCTKYGIFNY